jgi:hypothetical protein
MNNDYDETKYLFDMLIEQLKEYKKGKYKKKYFEVFGNQMVFRPAYDKNHQHLVLRKSISDELDKNFLEYSLGSDQKPFVRFQTSDLRSNSTIKSIASFLSNEVRRGLFKNL